MQGSSLCSQLNVWAWKSQKITFAGDRLKIFRSMVGCTSASDDVSSNSGLNCDQGREILQSRYIEDAFRVDRWTKDDYA